LETITRDTICPMNQADLQDLCERGQEQLMRMEYLSAEQTLCSAERIANELSDFDTLGRLYLPLQEARRQRRQRCGEGVVRLDLLAVDADDRVDGQRIIQHYPHGQLLVAGWGSIQPALEVRQLQQERGLFVETFLGAVYPLGDAARAVVIVPLADVALPDATPRSIDELLAMLPAHSIVYGEGELPKGDRAGTWETYAEVMAMWERLHAPFLAQADMMRDPRQKIEAYRKTIRVDYACELAHQRLADTARNLGRQVKAS
jgi:hypothetical protein